MNAMKDLNMCILTVDKKSLNELKTMNQAFISLNSNEPAHTYNGIYFLFTICVCVCLCVFVCVCARVCVCVGSYCNQFLTLHSQGRQLSG